ncbi:MAG: acyltransferase [Acidimicrobiales bacterium]
MVGEEPSSSRVYLRQFDLFRVIAFVGVIAQHVMLFTRPGGSDVGWSAVMVLHATRNVFFFLSALVAGYSQFRAPRPLLSLWVRRIGAFLLPYLAWTGIYFAYTLASSSGPVTARGTIVHDLLTGYYQLYFLVVLFQVYVVLPAVVWLVRRTRGHHGLVLGLSVAAQLCMMTIAYYFSWHTGPLHTVSSLDHALLGSRYVTGYQLYVVAGVLAADHLGQLQRLVERQSARICWGALAVGVATLGYYALQLAFGKSPGQASNLYQPLVVPWFLAACAGLWAVGWRWAHKASARAPTHSDRLVRWGADASAGVYLAHILVLHLILSALTREGLAGHGALGEAALYLILFAGVLLGTCLLVGVLFRTPLRTVLTGPDRRRQRAVLGVYPAPCGGTPEVAPDTVSAIVP